MRKITFISLIIVMVFLFTACKKEEEKKEVLPEERLAEYVQLWNKQDFEKMYEEYLSTPTIEEYTKEEMVDRYQDLYSDLEITNVNVTFEIPEEESTEDTEEEEGATEEAIFPIHVAMDSLAGPIQFDHEVILMKETREENEENWYVSWDTTFIFKQLEKGDEVGIKTVKGPRGEIYDRNGNGLAINENLKLIGIQPELMAGHEEETKKLLSEKLNLDIAYIDSQLNQSWVQPHLFVPLRTVDPYDKAFFDELMAIPGVVPQDQFGRYYPLGEAATHLVGYTGEITAEELEENKDNGYQMHDEIGKRGLELLFEEDLRGKPGAEIYITKTNGETVTIAAKNAEKGKDIHVTIDAEVQKAIYENMNGKEGSAAAIHPSTGETLALVSSPSFDANGLTSNYYSKLLEEPTNPLLNRFTALYAPGSTFKPVTASIALAKDVITPDKTLDLSGKQWGKGGDWGDYKITRVSDPGHPVDLHDAFVYSDNIYFAQTALEIGAEEMVSGLEAFGFNQEFPYTYPFSQSTVSNSGQLDNEILLADTGYGQGELQVSTLHLATMYTPIINNGNLVKPILLKDEQPEAWQEQIISPEDAEVIHAALRDVVASPSGTARGANMANIPLAGKTGTAELKTSLDESGKENGVFVAYEANKKDMVIAMLLEGVEEDGSSGYVVEQVKKVFERLY
jgi:penicillin-binding protein 3